MDAPHPAPEASATPTERSGGSMTTARSALQALALLQERPEGVRAEEVAAAIGKSLSTAYYVLRALCEEGFATHDDRGGLFRAEARSVAPPGPAGGPARELSLAALADELFARTHKRSYVGVLDGGAIEIVEVRGRQGLPRLPGMGDRISDVAHASAMGKVVLSLMRGVAVDRYVARGLKVVAPATVTDPVVLREQLAQARVDGFATDVEELAEDFCCVAAPVFGQDGGLRAVAGISMSRRAFEESLDVLSRAVREVAGTKLTIPGHGAPARPAAAGGGTPPRDAEATVTGTSARLSPPRPAGPGGVRRVPSMVGKTSVS
ncbi:IclR family transcriptional regulator [Patulibacter sp.]|uniref:IclR family transcriptional regulator n=1 Tax=Patulibacter sp. TaxID=1912859 RepID=UPI00271AC460|nr:IclR family transcriptional regulator C-terminal domain-containing protein [Patulibacter sp.]MDO9406878.1 IclR family transcriptional regulator C-terminal domain-containing protein [Patulibacter sp.]